MSHTAKSIVLALSDKTTPEVTLELELAISGKAEPGTVLEFEGVGKDFTQRAIHADDGNDESKISGWPAAAAAKKPPAAKKPKRR